MNTFNIYDQRNPCSGCITTHVAQVRSPVLPIPYVAQVLPIPYVAQAQPKYVAQCCPRTQPKYVAQCYPYRTQPTATLPQVKVLGASIFFWTLKNLFVLHCLQYGFLVWGFDGGCELMLARFAFYKSPEQELNLSRSQDKPTLILTILRSISKSSTKDLSLSVPERRLSLVLGRSLSLRVNTESGGYRRFPAQILTQRRSVIILQMVASGHWLFNQPHKPIV